MSQNAQSKDDGQNRQPSFISSTITVGVATGVTGAFVSSIIATLRASPRKSFFITATTINCFILGCGFYGTREYYSRQIFQFDPERVTRNDKIILSGTAASTVGGIWGAIIGGKRHAIPGFLVFGATGLAGQLLYNSVDKAHTTNIENQETSANVKKEGIISRILNSDASPIRKLSNEEYWKMLKEKQLKVDVEIALIDERIEELKKQQEEERRLSGQNLEKDS